MTIPFQEITISDQCSAISILQETLSLGDTLVSVVSVLEKFYHAVGPVKISKNEKKTINLHVICQQVILSFDYVTQRLHRITLQTVKKLVLRYRSENFSSPQEALLPSLREINESFGATRPGKINKDSYTTVL